MAFVHMLEIIIVITGRAYGNFGLSHESLGNHEEAVRYQEKHLSMAAQLQDKVAKTMAFSSLGKLCTDQSSKMFPKK